MLEKIKKAIFKFKPFSKKQKKILTWWLPNSPVKDKNGIIADGAIRSGKTLSMSLSFAIWAMETFDQQSFGMCGKTIGSFRRNVLFWLKLMLKARGYRVEDKRSENLLVIKRKGKVNYFYIFGGKDERSQDLIQGITLAGIFFDEVALMPESFVNQATGRCSVDGSKFWFNCNPAGPYHWFKVNWIDNRKEKDVIYLHFTMDDNLSLSEAVKERYRKMFSGVFYKRYILGLWVLAEGIIYDMFQEIIHKVTSVTREYEKYYVSIDYGTQNACVFLLLGLCDDKWYVVKEYYYSGRDSDKQKTDAEYSQDLKEFTDGISYMGIIIDPSAASFIAQLKKDGFRNILKAKNEVEDGIRKVSTMFSNQLLFICDCCANTLKEISSYIWDKNKGEKGQDVPVKQFDHAMDALRYFINTVDDQNIRIRWI